MQVVVLEEAGYNHALLGVALSFHDRATPIEAWWGTDKQSRARERAATLAFMGSGHNKFLESMQVWVNIEAPRAWWSEFDTYRVGMTKQSESTMHTLQKRPPTVLDFEVGTPLPVIEAFCGEWANLRNDIHALKMMLPEGFLQRRIVCTNYMVLQNIIRQRRGHRLKLWDEFCDEILTQAAHPEFLERRE